MAAGYRSLLALWIGGAGNGTSAPQAGFRSLLAPWIGGASSPAAVAASGGVRSLLAFWMGGASGVAGVPPQPAPVEEQFSGGWLPSTYRERRRLEDQIAAARKALEAVVEQPIEASVSRETSANVAQNKAKRTTLRLQKQGDAAMLERLRLLVEIDRLEAKIRAMDEDVAVILLASLAY